MLSHSWDWAIFYLIISVSSRFLIFIFSVFVFPQTKNPLTYKSEKTVYGDSSGTFGDCSILVSSTGNLSNACIISTGSSTTNFTTANPSSTTAVILKKQKNFLSWICWKYQHFAPEMPYNDKKPFIFDFHFFQMQCSVKKFFWQVDFFLLHCSHVHQAHLPQVERKTPCLLGIGRILPHRKRATTTHRCLSRATQRLHPQRYQANPNQLMLFDL